MNLHDLWFVVVAVLWIGYFFLEGFDFGVGILTRLLARDRRERRVLINTIGPVWDGNEVWLLAAGGSMFAAFPQWYATLFSGFYLPFLLVLVCLIVRGVAFEYRGKRAGARWQTAWEHAIFWCSLLPAFLWGLVFANIVHGVPINGAMDFTGGLADLVHPYALLGGFTTLFLFTMHGAVFVGLKTVGEIRLRARRFALAAGAVTALLALAFLGWTQADRGDSATLITALVAVVALLAALGCVRAGREGWAFLFSGLTVIAAVATLFLALFPDVMPSTLRPEWSLTAANAASGPYTLKVMSWIGCVMVPLVALYQGWTYWVFKKRIGTRHIPPEPGAAGTEEPSAPAAPRPAAATPGR